MRNYIDEMFGKDYLEVRDFLIELGNANYTFGRWDWMITHPNLDRDNLKKIGMWHDGNKLVGLATFDTDADGMCFIFALKGYEHLYKEMIEYAEKNLSGEDGFSIMISDTNEGLQLLAQDMGFIATTDKEASAAFDISDDRLNYALPEGYSLTSMEDTFDLTKYGKVMFYGFGHGEEAEFDPTEEDAECALMGMKRPNVDLSIKIAAVAPDGDFASYCGMWVDEKSGTALVEPVATHPNHRKLGLAKACVYEAIKRCGKKGAKIAYVGSDQQFYYSIGFRPIDTMTKWRRR